MGWSQRPTCIKEQNGEASQNLRTSSVDQGGLYHVQVRSDLIILHRRHNGSGYKKKSNATWLGTLHGWSITFWDKEIK